MIYAYNWPEAFALAACMVPMIILTIGFTRRQ